MGVRGRPRKPVEQLKLAGTFRPDRHGDRAEVAVDSGAPVRPSLTGEAAWLWDTVIQPLVAKKLLVAADSAAIRCVCDLWAKYVAASQRADQLPTDKDARIAVATYYASYERAAAKVGLSPVDRQHLRPGEEKPADSSISGFARKRG